jgi:hypothetical protein
MVKSRILYEKPSGQFLSGVNLDLFQLKIRFCICHVLFMFPLLIFVLLDLEISFCWMLDRCFAHEFFCRSWFRAVIFGAVQTSLPSSFPMPDLSGVHVEFFVCWVCHSLGSVFFSSVGWSPAGSCAAVRQFFLRPSYSRVCTPGFRTAGFSRSGSWLLFGLLAPERVFVSWEADFSSPRFSSAPPAQAPVWPLLICHSLKILSPLRVLPQLPIFAAAGKGACLCSGSSVCSPRAHPTGNFLCCSTYLIFWLGGDPCKSKPISFSSHRIKRFKFFYYLLCFCIGSSVKLTRCSMKCLWDSKKSYCSIYCCRLLCSSACTNSYFRCGS